MKKYKICIKDSIENFIENNGNNNVVYANNIEKIENQFHITFNGNNNKVYLNNIKGNGKLYINMNGNKSEFSLGLNNIVNNDIIIEYWNARTNVAENVKIKIGNDNEFNGEKIKIISPLNTKIVIGNRNLFAGDIMFWGRNDHVIYDKRSKKRLNIDEDIIIGNENWICQEVRFLPGAKISNYSVVALGTIVNKKFNSKNILIAGVPGKIQKENIGWSISSNIKNVDFSNSIKTKEGR